MPGSARQQMFKEEETETPSGPLVSLECNFFKKKPWPHSLDHIQFVSLLDHIAETLFVN